MPTPRPARALLPCFPLLLLSACGGESVKDVIDRHRETATPRIQRVDSLRQVVEKLPPLETDTLVWDGFSIQVDGSSRRFGDNVRTLYLPAFQTSEAPLADPWGVDWTDAWWRLTGKSLRDGWRPARPARRDGAGVRGCRYP